MSHFFYLVAFGFFVSAAFAVFAEGSVRDRVIYGLKTFGQFIGISLLFAWLLYFIPW